MADIVKDYAKGDLTIQWKPAKCIHSEICVKTLPEVYKPSEKPWIQPDGVTEEDLMKQIDGCPSAALTYTRKGEAPAAAAGNSTEIEVVPPPTSLFVMALTRKSTSKAKPHFS